MSMNKKPYFSYFGFIYYLSCCIMIISCSGALTPVRFILCAAFIILVYTAYLFGSDFLEKPVIHKIKKIDMELLGKKIITFIFIFLFFKIFFNAINVKNNIINLISFCAASPFFFEIISMRRFFFIASLFIINMSMQVSANGINIIILSFYFASLFAYLFSISNYNFSIVYAGCRKKFGIIDLKHLAYWLCAAFIIFIPFLTIIFFSGKDCIPVKSAMSKNNEIQRVKQNFKNKAFLNLVSASAATVLLIFLMKKIFERHRDKHSSSDSEIEAQLTNQGFIKELEKKVPIEYFYPKNNSGEILKKYELFILAAEKKCGVDLFNFTPLERSEKLLILYPDLKSELSAMTGFFIKARYSCAEITDSELSEFEDYLLKFSYL